MSNIKIKKPVRSQQPSRELFETPDDAEPIMSPSMVDGPRRERPMTRAPKEARGVAFDEAAIRKTPRASDFDTNSDTRLREFPKAEESRHRRQLTTQDTTDDQTQPTKQVSTFFGSVSSATPHLANHTRSFWMKNVELCCTKFDGNSNRDNSSPHIASWSGSSRQVSRLLNKCLSDPSSACLVTRLNIKATIRASKVEEDRWKDLEDIFNVIRLKLGGEEVFSMGFHDGTVAGLCLFHPQQSCFLNRECSIVDELIEFSFDLPIPFFKFASLPIGPSTSVMLESIVHQNVDIKSVQLFADIQVTDIKLNPVSTLYWPTVSSIISTMGCSSDSSNQNIVLQLAMPVTALIVVLDIVSRLPNQDQTAIMPSDGTVTFCYEQTDVQTVDFVRTPSRDWTYHALIPFSPDWNSARAPYFYLNDGIIKINFDRTKDEPDIIQSVISEGTYGDRYVAQKSGIEYRVSIVAVKPASVKSTKEGYFSRH